MAAPASVATFWLPAWATLRAHIAPTLALHRLACRADREVSEAGEAPRLARSFDVLPRSALPVAALTRQHDAGDALQFTWLRADPACVRPDMASARLLACGDLDISAEECEALLAPLRPLFGDEGFPISAPVPSRWYLCLPQDARLPEFAPPEAVFGDDLFAYLPEGDGGRRWRRLLNEAQVVLHNHPINARRVAAGKLPINSLWFWGGGRLPDHVRSSYAEVHSDDVVVAALAERAGARLAAIPAAWPDAFSPLGMVARMEQDQDRRMLRSLGVDDTDQHDRLFDFRHLRDIAWLDSQWLEPAMRSVAADHLAALELDFGDGLLLRWQRHHRWRVWRRHLPA